MPPGRAISGRWRLSAGSCSGSSTLLIWLSLLGQRHSLVRLVLHYVAVWSAWTPIYHAAIDTVDTFDYAHMAKVVDGMLSIVVSLARAGALAAIRFVFRFLLTS